MKEKLEFGIILFCLAWGVYKYFRTKDERVIYGMIVFASVFSAKYPLRVPVEFCFSFNGFFGFVVLLYKWLSQRMCVNNLVSLKKEMSESSFPTAEITEFGNKTEFSRNLMAFAVLSLMFGVIFLVQGLVFPGFSLPVGNSLMISLEFALSFCAFLGFGFLLYHILRCKL